LDRSPGGLGIGLTIVRRLVLLHGGRVEARSDGPGRGSEFVVRLPASHVGAAAATARDDAAPATAGARRVLIVEDNHDAAEGLATLLQVWGHEVRVAY